MELEIVRADPAGNITIFVLNGVANRKERAQAARALLADPALKAEQAGFVFPPQKAGSLWRLEMMGGEFCGNAARSFGLLAARLTGLSGRHTLMIESSGASAPLPVHIDTGAGSAEVEISAPAGETCIEYGRRRFPVYMFEGISHIIAENIESGEDLARLLIRALISQEKTEGGHFDAVGVMFYDTKKCFLRPAVWVKATDTLVFESSCGSGSAALGAWMARNAADIEETLALAQSGGVISVRIVKQGGKITKLSIGGKVLLGDPFRYNLPVK